MNYTNSIMINYEIKCFSSISFSCACSLNNDDNETILNIPVPIQAQTAVDLLNSDDETGEDKVLPVQNGRLEIKLKGNWGAVLKIKGEN